jgi:hypothetical protein
MQGISRRQLGNTPPRLLPQPHRRQRRWRWRGGDLTAATARHPNGFLDPATDGAVLPILHLNGYRISNPTVLARITREELDQLVGPRLRVA